MTETKTPDTKTTPPQLRLERAAVTIERVGISRSTMWRLTRLGLFPQPVPVAGSGRVAYVTAEVDEWIQQRLAERAGQQRGPRGADDSFVDSKFARAKAAKRGAQAADARSSSAA